MGCEANHAEGVYIIRSLPAVYHQHEVLYIIKPQENARWRVMRYSPKGADDMHHASRGDDMPSLREPPKLGKLASGNPYCGLDKKIRILSNADFLAHPYKIDPWFKVSR